MRIYLLLFILLLPSVFAQEITSSLYQEIYQPGETLQLEFTTSNLVSEPSTANIKLFDSLNNEIKVAPFLLKIKPDNYFVYFDLPENLADGSYRLVLNKLKVNVDGVLKEVNHEINFNLTKKTSIVSISPAVFILNKDSELQVQLNNKGPLVAVELTTSDFIKHPYTGSEQLTGFSSRKFYFDADLTGIVYNTKGYININYSNESYAIPVFIITGSLEPIQAFEFITELTSLSRTLNKKEEVRGGLGIRNRLNEDLKDVYFELTGNLNEIIKLNITHVQAFESQSIINELFIINKDKNPQLDSYLGNFIVKSEQYSASFPIYIQFREESEIPREEVKTIKEEPVKEQELFALPPPVPVSIEPESKLGFYLIILVLLVVAAIIYKLSRKSKQKKSFKEYLSTIKR